MCALSLDELHSTTAVHWRKDSDYLDLGAKAKISIRTKAHGEDWVDLLDATVPNDKAWHVEITVHADETEPVP